MADSIDLDTLANKIRDALGRAPKPGGDEEMGEGRIPQDRFRAMVRERDEARAQLLDLGKQFEAFQAASKSATDAVRSEAQKAMENLTVQHAEDVALVEAGVRDPLGRTALRQAWQAAPKAERGDSPAAWWQGLIAARDAHTADPEKAQAPQIPRTLAGYLPDPPKVEEAPKAQRKAPPAAGAPAPRNGKDPFAGLSADATMDDFFKAMR